MPLSPLDQESKTLVELSVNVRYGERIGFDEVLEDGHLFVFWKNPILPHKRCNRGDSLLSMPLDKVMTLVLFHELVREARPVFL